jgi:hypothetical protein
MNITLSPDRPLVEKNTILNLTLRKDNGNREYGLYLVNEDFDYNEVLAAIRIDGAVKSEEVLHKLTQTLLDRNIIMAVSSYSLDLGERGRACEALQESYKYQLNDWSCMAKVLITELEKGYFDFLGPEGLIHLLKVNSGDTLGQVFIEIRTSEYQYTTLDLVGPEGADYPPEFAEMIKQHLSNYLRNKYQDIAFEMFVSLRQSELSQAMEVLDVVKSKPNHRHFHIGVAKRTRRTDDVICSHSIVDRGPPSL